MNIKDFVNGFKNHPVLFIGTGISLRYLENSFTWNSLLKKIAFDLYENEEYYLDLKSQCHENGEYQYEKVATLLEKDFNHELSKNRNGKFKNVNDIFYKNMEDDINLSRFKIYISQLLSDNSVKDEMLEEITELKKTRKNISCIITTNYDKFIEDIFKFKPLIGNNILLSNPYGSVYKIHGCISQQDKMIITEDDYKDFLERYELIRAQLLSLFIHNPIIFMGYSISDDNIKNILKTIFTYIQPNSEEAELIRKNFLLVEYEKGSSSDKIIEHDIDMKEFSIIRINKLKTDSFIPLYSAISDLNLPVSAMDIRKVQNVVKEIYSGGEIKVSITDDLDEVNNNDKILAIGSKNTISYQYKNTSEMILNYFQIIDESNYQILTLVDKLPIQSNQYFPIFGFDKVNIDISKSDELKKQQIEKLNAIISGKESSKITNDHFSIQDINNDDNISNTYKNNAIVYGVMNKQINLNEFKSYLLDYEDKKDTNYRKLICAYDYMLYSLD